MAKQTNTNKKSPPPARPLADVPRRWLNVAVVIGGIIGLMVGQLLRWSDVQTFFLTLLVAGICVLLCALLYRAAHRQG